MSGVLQYPHRRALSTCELSFACSGVTSWTSSLFVQTFLPCFLKELDDCSTSRSAIWWELCLLVCLLDMGPVLDSCASTRLLSEVLMSEHLLPLGHSKSTACICAELTPHLKRISLKASFKIRIAPHYRETIMHSHASTMEALLPCGVLPTLHWTL